MNFDFWYDLILSHWFWAAPEPNQMSCDSAHSFVSCSNEIKKNFSQMNIMQKVSNEIEKKRNIAYINLADCH